MFDQANTVKEKSEGRDEGEKERVGENFNEMAQASGCLNGVHSR